MIKLYINLPYMGNAGEELIKSCIKKLKRNIRKEVQVKFVVTYNTTKLTFFTNMKDRITNIGKTERTLCECINEHGYREKDSMINNHITNCKGVSYLTLVDLLNINNNSAERGKIDK